MSLLLKETIYLSNEEGIEKLEFSLSDPSIKDEERNTYEVEININFKNKKIERKIKAFSKTQALCAGLSLLKNEIKYLIYLVKNPLLFASENNAINGKNPFEIKHIFIDIDDK